MPAEILAREQEQVSLLRAHPRQSQNLRSKSYSRTYKQLKWHTHLMNGFILLIGTLPHLMQSHEAII